MAIFRKVPYKFVNILNMMRLYKIWPVVAVNTTIMRNLSVHKFRKMVGNRKRVNSKEKKANVRRKS